METKDCIRERRSIRKFQDREVPKELVEQLVSLASYSPSWKNSQVVRYIAVSDEELKNRIADEAVMGHEGNIRNIKGAPLLIVMTLVHGRSGYERTGEPTTSKGNAWEVFDSGIAAQTLSLAAYENGLGSLIMGIFDEEKVKELVGAPDDQIVSCLVALGYPDQDPEAPKRKDVSELLTWR